MSTNPTVIYSAANTQQAYLLRSLLEDEGIQARVVNDSLQIAGGELPLGWTAAARVVVPEQDAPRARELAEHFDRQTAHPLAGEETSSAPAAEPWPDWPTCPQCGTRQSAQCPICGTVGTDFPLADYQPTATGDRVLLMCRTCDDHMLPEWYRFCPGCNYDFGAGIEPAPMPAANNRLSLATVLIIALLLLPALALGAYFWWLLS